MSFQTSLRALRTASSSSHRQASTSTRTASLKWPTKSHMRPAPTIPEPLPAIYAQKILLSDGSTFTSYTTAPTPAIVRLTRDVTNNPLWAPGREKRGLGEGGEGVGRVGRFKQRFAGTDEQGAQAGFGESDFSWMSEGAKAETVSAKEMQGRQKPSAKKK